MDGTVSQFGAAKIGVHSCASVTLFTSAHIHAFTRAGFVHMYRHAFMALQIDRLSPSSSQYSLNTFTCAQMHAFTTFLTKNLTA